MIWDIAYALLSGAGIIFGALVSVGFLLGAVWVLLEIAKKGEGGVFVAWMAVLWMIASVAIYFTRAAGVE